MKKFDHDLLEENVIDHQIMYFKIKVNNKQTYFNLFSLNIAQRSDIRSMCLYNKFHTYLRKKKFDHFHNKLFSKNVVRKLFDSTPYIILKYNLHEKYNNIQEGSKELITDKEIIEEVRKLLPSEANQIAFLYIRRYVPSTSSKEKYDIIFRERYKKTNFFYFDLVFVEETIQEYKNRIRKVMNVLVNQIQNKSNCIICLQEICPPLDFIDVINTEYKDILRIVDPKFDSSFKKYNEKIFMKSINFLLVKRNFRYRIIKENTENNIIKFFSSYGCTSAKNPYQNIQYKIPKLNLDLYNVHGNLLSNKSLLDSLQKNILNQIDNHYFEKSIIILGDLNFRLNHKYYNLFFEKFRDYKFFFHLEPLPFSKQDVFEGILYRIL